MVPVWRFARHAICVASTVIAIPVLLSGTMRSTYLSVAEKKIATIWPLQYAFVGSSLTANCNWMWDLGTLSVVNLGVWGSDIRDISHQVVQALILRPSFLAIEGGINDVLLNDISAARVAEDYDYMLRQIPAGQRTAVTLIPFVSNRSNNAKIEAANSGIKAVAETRGVRIIDLNPRLAIDGVRKPEMTTDGVHFTRQACRIWADEISAKSNY